MSSSSWAGEGKGCCWALTAGSQRTRARRSATGLSGPLEFRCLLDKACLPLGQEEQERTFALKWFLPLGETPEADEYQVRACALHPLPSF